MASSSSCQEILGLSPKEYDVFISHRGSDVKETLANKLCNLLQERGCRTFLDSSKQIAGADSDIPSSVRNGICSSFVQIAIFSKGAFSHTGPSSFLNQLVLMLEQPDALFIPVFYDVQPLELRSIANESSSFYFSLRMGSRGLNRRERALIAASYFSGYQVSQHKDNVCEKIVSRLLQVLQRKEKWIPLHVAEYPVGLAELVQDFEKSRSETEEKDKVKMVGIFGLGGSGKTTLAKQLFNMKRLGYSASCFLSDVRESHAKGELHCLQSQLFKDLFDEDRTVRNNINEGLEELKDRFEKARHLDLLIVLDDIDHLEQLRAPLFEGVLSPGSLLIVTTRVQSVLTGVHIRYRMKGLDKGHDKDLFLSHAFRGKNPPIAYEKLVRNFVKFCGGLPLSLKVLGANVYGRDVHFWELELEKVRKTLPKDIMERLITSFDGLNSQERQIFIDIACFLDMELTWYMKNRASLIWSASGWNVEDAVHHLQDKCLVEVSGHFQSFEMQNHLRDLGRQMADELGPPRLWQPDLLKSMEAKGFKQILAESNTRCFHSFEDSSLKTRFTYFKGSLNDSAEAELLLLEINNYLGNLKSIPPWIPLCKLRCLTVRNMEEIWSTFQQQLQTNSHEVEYKSQITSLASIVDH